MSDQIQKCEYFKDDQDKSQTESLYEVNNKNKIKIISTPPTLMFSSVPPF